MSLNWDPCKPVVESLVCTRFIPETPTGDNCTEYFQDRNFWSMIHNNHIWNESDAAKDLKADLDHEFGFHKLFDYHADELGD